MVIDWLFPKSTHSSAVISFFFILFFITYNFFDGFSALMSISQIAFIFTSVYLCLLHSSCRINPLIKTMTLEEDLAKSHLEI